MCQNRYCLRKKKNAFTSVFFEKAINELEKVTFTKRKKKPILNKSNLIIADETLVQTEKVKNILLGELKKAQSEFKSYKNGIGVAATITGSVLACNLVTPICRNLIANQFQTKYINKNKAKSTFAFATTKTFNAFKI